MSCHVMLCIQPRCYGLVHWFSTVDCSKIYAITSKALNSDEAQFLDIIDAKTGDIEQSLAFTDIIGKQKCSGVGGLALL